MPSTKTSKRRPGDDRSITMRLPEADWAEAGSHAARLGTNRSELMKLIFHEWLHREGRMIKPATNRKA